jgi:hypothetical protein
LDSGSSTGTRRLHQRSLKCRGSSSDDEFDNSTSSDAGFAAESLYGLCDWEVTKAELDAESTTSSAIQQSYIGIDCQAPNFSASAVVDNEISVYAVPHPVVNVLFVQHYLPTTCPTTPEFINVDNFG